MADYRKLIPHIKRWEGGFVHDPDDLGGATNKGITYATLQRYYRIKGYPRPSVDTLRRLTDEQWSDIYKTLYWDVCKAAEIKSQAVANMLVDWYWHAGSNATKGAQKVLGVIADGVVGAKTIMAINTRPPKQLYEELKQARIAYYNRIVASRPTNRKYLRGWLNRVNALKYE